MDIYSLKEISEKLQLPVNTLRQHIKAGKLKASKLGKHIRISEQQLKDYLKLNEVGGD
jgi:excisionase family DNA binding protein